MVEEDKPFTAIWPDDKFANMNSGHLQSLSCDAESWANFLALVLRRRTSATMRVYNAVRPNDRQYIKVIWAQEGQHPSYADLP